MSTYYEFYVGKKTNDKIEAIGPYARNGEVYSLIPVLSRSRSFIDWEEFDAWTIPIEMMTDDQLDFFSSEGWTGDERYSLSYSIPYEDICAMASNGIRQGYVTLEELDEAASSDYDPDVLYGLWVRTPEMIAEMDPEERKKYGHIAFVDHLSTGYICGQLINAVDSYDYETNVKDLVFIVRIC